MNNTDLPSVEYVLYKIGCVFSRTKDVLLKDFLENMEDYLPGISDADNYSYDAFEQALKNEGTTHIEKFIEGLFNRLGYDISSFKNNKELTNIIKSIIAATNKIEKAVNALSEDGINWMEEAEKFMEDTQQGERQIVKAKDFFNDPDIDNTDGISFGNNNVSISLDFGNGNGKISTILRLILDVILLIRKIRDIEWDKLMNEYKEFAEFIEESYLNKKFAERLLDHILVVLLRNAKEVFADDISSILKHIDKAKQDIVKNVNEEIKGNIDEIINQIKDLQTEIQELETQIKKESQQLLDEAKKYGTSLVTQVHTELTTQLRIAKARLEQLTSEIFGDYNRLGKTFNQIYAILDFLQVIRKETIEIAKYVPDAPAIPEINLTDVNTQINLANKAISDVNKGIEEANKEIENASKHLKSLCPTIEVHTISWTRLEKIFTGPIDYFKEIYPIKDYDDAEELLAKILDVIRAFNNDIPDFTTIKQILYELLIRVRNKIKEGLSGEVSKKFARFENFIIDLLKLLEKFAIGIRDKLNEAYSNFEEDKDSLIKELQTRINEAFEEIKDNVNTVKKEITNFKIPDTNIKFKKINGVDYDQLKNYLKKTFVDSFIRIVGEKAKEHELFNNIKPEDWKKVIEKSIDEKFDKNLILEYKPILEEMEKYITGLFDDNIWENKFKSVISNLKKEFEHQTKDIPQNFDEVKDYCKGSINNLIKGNDLKNPFSNFDFNDYLIVFSDSIKAIVPDSPEIYYIKFREATIGSLEILLSTSDAVFESVRKNIEKTEYDKKLKAFAIDVFTSYWSELKKALYKTLVRPFITLLEKTIKTWISETLLPEIISFVRTNIENELNFTQYIEVFEEVEEFKDDVKEVYITVKEKAETTNAIAKDACEMAMNILTLAYDAKDIDSWQDGLRFAINVYRIIPPTIKAHLRELIDLPQWNFDNIQLPDYKLDIKNKFFAVTLYEYPDKKNDKSEKFDASISIKLLALVGDRKIRDNNGTPKKDEDGDDIVESGLYILPVIRGKFGVDFELGKNHLLQLSANAKLNPEPTEASKNENNIKEALERDTLGFFFTTKNGESLPSVVPLFSENSFSAYLELLFQRVKGKGKEDNKLEIFKTDIAELTIGNYPQKLFIGYSDGSFDCGYLGGLRELQLTLKLHEINDFFATILKNDIVAVINKLDLGYSLSNGFQLDGKYKVQIPFETDINLKSVMFKDITLELGNGESKNFVANVKTNFTADFKGVAFSFSEMGFGIDCNFMKPDGSFGDFDLSPRFKFPDGVAIAINTEAVKGAGIIKWNKGREEFLGAMELSILDLCSAGALVLFNMKMPDGSKGFSFMGALSVFFTPGIQLGMGFSLTAIGGSLGVNRGISSVEIQKAVRDGSLGSILFVKDLDKNLDKVLGNISIYYPIQKDQIFFGFLTQITWGEILKVDLGLFIQLPNPVVIMIAGAIKISAGESMDKLLAINVYFLGIIDFSKGLSFDASLVDSHIVGITMYGDMALRIYWAGENKGFLLSAGGFHPKYKPEAGFNIGEMKRIGMKLDFKILKLSLESYFAITSNTVQFGADVRVQIGWDKFGISGYLYFNALFQFKPFKFLFDFGAGMAVKCGSWTLLSINLSGEMSGPAPWNMKGKASFWFLFIKIKVDVNLTWGKKQVESNRKYIDVMPIYSANFHENANWKTISSDIEDRLVKVVQLYSKDLVMQPSDTLLFNQSAVPLDEKIERYGEAFPGDVQEITLTSVKISGKEQSKENYTSVTSSFAPTLIRNLNDEEKIAAPSYVKMNAGFKLTAGLDERKGNAEDVSPIVEKNWQKVDDVWSIWEKYAANSQKQLLKKSISDNINKRAAKVLIKETKKSDKLYENRISDSTRLHKKVENRQIQRPSSRRTNDGFSRYTRQMDASMTSRIETYIERLNENSKNKSK